MPANKDRLYIALHVRGGQAKMPAGEDKYHWSLFLGPKPEKPSSACKILHAKETITPFLHDDPGAGGGSLRSTWIFEERDVSLANAPAAGMILARICVGKVLNRERLLSILRDEVPIRGGGGGGGGQEVEGWNCVTWVQEALELLLLHTNNNDDGSGGAVLGTNRVQDWKMVRDESMRYVERKTAAHRYDGNANEGEFDMNKMATWDMLRGREIIR